jgi:hypothetical protein
MHDPEKWKPVFRRDKRESVCAEIMHQKIMHDPGGYQTERDEQDLRGNR